MTETLTEEKLNQLAEAVANNENLLTLGLNLGFKESKVKIYISTNKRNDSFEGTSSMLFAWKKKTRRAKQIPDLIKALVDAELAELVDDFFPSDEDGSTPPGNVKENGTMNKNGNPDSAEELEDIDDILVKIAKKVQQNSEIDTLGSKLGISPEDVQRYIATNNKTQHITWDGTLQMLRDWFKNQKKSGRERDALKAALEKAGHIRLADELFS
ncbi:uncharacterized protein LOC121419987 [Lytechinus variegatus]|uniref:uncharacterized protein LOC121419987 n=1 Tax=Lytechinus variegatus TaxID=7654 RepID=UPI001BB16592|nr:uncharacterized protein LOC121419987 [Lytechinus variegatus]